MRYQNLEPNLCSCAWISYPQHLQSVMQLAGDATLPAGPTLLVTCEVRSRWSASLAANLLREHGAPQVLLLGPHLLA